MLLLAKLQAYFTKSNTPPWVFFTFLKLYKWYQIVQRITGRYEIPKKSKLKGPLYLIMQVNKQIKKIGKGQKKVSIIFFKRY